MINELINELPSVITFTINWNYIFPFIYILCCLIAIPIAFKILMIYFKMMYNLYAKYVFQWNDDNEYDKSTHEMIFVIIQIFTFVIIFLTILADLNNI